MATPKAIKAKRWDILHEAVPNAYRAQDAQRKSLPDTHMLQQFIWGVCVGLAAVGKFLDGTGIGLLEHLQQFKCPACKQAACVRQDEPMNLVQIAETWSCPKCGWTGRPIARELKR